MKKGRKNMYDVVTKEKRNSNKNFENFFLKPQLQEKENMKIVVSREIAYSFGNDMHKFVNFMTNDILEGLLNGRR